MKDVKGGFPLPQTDALQQGIKGTWTVTDATIQLEGLGGKDRWNNWIGSGQVSYFIPERKSNILAAGNALECILKAEHIRAMPGREQNCTVPAIATPPSWVLRSQSAPRHSMKATDEREGVQVVR